MIPDEQLTSLQNEITQGTNGQAVMELGDKTEYAILDGNVMIF